MSLSLIPSRLYDSYSGITAKELQSLGIKLLVSDLDFTLASNKDRQPDDALRQWIADLKAGGIEFVIISNNRSRRRIEEFCKDLGVPYMGRARKPSTSGLRSAMEWAGVDAAHTAMLGDKLLTDVLSAKRAGVLALMVEPAGGPAGPWEQVLHVMQEPFKEVRRRRDKKAEKAKQEEQEEQEEQEDKEEQKTAE